MNESDCEIVIPVQIIFVIEIVARLRRVDDTDVKSESQQMLTHCSTVRRINSCIRYSCTRVIDR